MKRLNTLLFIGALLICVCSCSTEESNDSTVSNATEESIVETGSIADIVDQPELMPTIVGTSVEPTIGTTTETDGSISGAPEVYYPVINSIVDCIDNYDPNNANTYIGSEYGGGVLELCSYDNVNEVVAFSFVDIDGDGVVELAILDLNDYVPNKRIIDLYTYSGGEIIHILSGGYRCRYYLTNDMRIYNEGSSGAEYSSVAWYEYNPETYEIDLIESYYTMPEDVESLEGGIVVYHTTNQASILADGSDSTNVEVVNSYTGGYDFYGEYGVHESDLYDYDSVTSLAEYCESLGR